MQLSIDDLQRCRRALRQYGQEIRQRFLGAAHKPVWVEDELLKVLDLMQRLHAELVAKVGPARAHLVQSPDMVPASLIDAPPGPPVVDSPLPQDSPLTPQASHQLRIFDGT